MTDKQEYKFHLSIKSADGTIIGARGDTVEETILNVEELQSKFGVKIAPPKTETPAVAQPSEPEHYCSMHSTPLKERIFKGKNFGWDHRKQENGIWLLCSGTGWHEQIK